MTNESVRANTQSVDPFSFEDPRFAGVDTTLRRDDLPTGPDNEWYDPGFVATQRVPNRSKLMEDLSTIADETPEAQAILDEEIAAATPQPAPVAPVIATPVVIPEVDEPEILEYDDGSSVTIEKTNRGWSATLDSNTGAGVEIFRGKTKDEMWKNLAAGKLNANKKIRDLNRQIKIGTSQSEPAAPPVTAVRQLSADDVFEIKTQLNNNPDLALEKWFQKKTGKTVEELVALAERGQQADEKLNVEEEARAFRADYPEYYPTDENLQALDDYLINHKLPWNSQNLGIAFEDLTADGLLDVAPKRATSRPVRVPQATPVVATPTPVPAPAPTVTNQPTPDPRIAGRRVGPRAGLGIRQSEVTNTPVVDNRPPSDEELDNLSNDEINQLFAGVRKLRAQSSRR